jgi:RHS repeat-associated protein
MEKWMRRNSRNVVLVLLALLLGASASLHAQTPSCTAAATACLTVDGVEQSVSGSWDAGTITVTAVNGDSESIVYGQYSTTTSVASNLAALFARDYAATLYAKAYGATIVFVMKSGTCAATASSTGPQTSFQIDTSAWPTTTTCGGSSSPVTGFLGLTCSPTSIVAGATTSCTANLVSGATGTVTFSDASGSHPAVSVASGQAAISGLLSTLGAGTYTITAVYSGDTNYLSGTLTATVTITAAPTPGVGLLSLDCGPADTLLGVSGGCTANLASGATGSVMFSYSGGPSTVTVASGHAATGDILSTLGVGTYTITAIYTGDTNYPAATLTATVTVTADPSQIANQPGAIYSYSIGTASTSGYDAAGNVIAYTDSVNGTWSAGYDNLNRLTTATFTAIGGTQKNMCWTYDAFGNRLTQKTDTVAGCTSTTPLGFQTSTIVAGVNQIATSAWSNVGSSNSAVGFIYDAAGNVTNDGQNHYVYDAEGNLCASQNIAAPGAITQYLYDADGNRVAKGTLRPGATQTLACIDPSNIATDFLPTTIYQGQQEYAGDGVTLERTYINEGKDLEASVDGNGTPHYQLTDWLGNRRMQVDASGTVVEGSYQNLPFGDGLVITGDASVHKHFTGKERDDETGTAGGHDGLDYFGARYDSSKIGRWLTPDWAVKEEPIPYAKMDMPQSMNLYVYVGNNPLTSVDADGHLGSEWHFGITLVAALVTDHGVGESLKLAAQTVWVDFRSGSQKTDAADANKHSMEGLKPDNTYQNKNEADKNTSKIISDNEKKGGDTALAIHAAEDRATPLHEGHEWHGEHLNVETAKHVLGDHIPSLGTIGNAYHAAVEVLKSQQTTQQAVPPPKRPDEH